MVSAVILMQESLDCFLASDDENLNKSEMDKQDVKIILPENESYIRNLAIFFIAGFIGFAYYSFFMFV